MTDIALVDTGFWIAFFDPGDQHHESAVEREDFLELAVLIVPWPVVYETLRTKFVRRPNWMLGLDRLLKKPSVQLVDDRLYRQDAYSMVIEYSTQLRRPISMVDMLCRLLIADSRIHIDYLLTTNPKDYVDVCTSHHVEFL